MHLDAGADLGDARRLLVDLDVEAGVQQMQRRGKAADAAADDRDLHCNTCLMIRPLDFARGDGDAFLPGEAGEVAR